MVQVRIWISGGYCLLHVVNHWDSELRRVIACQHKYFCATGKKDHYEWSMISLDMTRWAVLNDGTSSLEKFSCQCMSLNRSLPLFISVKRHLSYYSRRRCFRLQQSSCFPQILLLKPRWRSYANWHYYVQGLGRGKNYPLATLTTRSSSRRRRRYLAAQWCLWNKTNLMSVYTEWSRRR